MSNDLKIYLVPDLMWNELFFDNGLRINFSDLKSFHSFVIIFNRVYLVTKDGMYNKRFILKRKSKRPRKVLLLSLNNSFLLARLDEIWRSKEHYGTNWIKSFSSGNFIVEMNKFIDKEGLSCSFEEKYFKFLYNLLLK